MKWIKYGLKLFLILFGIYLFYINVRVNTRNEFKDGYNLNVYYQLRYLKKVLHQGAADDMQKLFPEGFVFLNAVYALTWANLVSRVDQENTIFKEALQEMDWSLDQILSEKGTSVFSSNLNPSYGAYFKGWSAYVLGKRLNLDTSISKQLIFKKYCQEIDLAIRNSRSPFLESYHGQCWPADMSLCLASLNLHDQIFEAKYNRTINTWIDSVASRLDSVTGLIPHSTYPISGKLREGGRGCSQSLTLLLLNEIDHPFVDGQFEQYKKLFLTSRFGLPGIREYPEGQIGLGDVDSGPVVLGIGGAASIVGQATMWKFGERSVAIGLRQAIEAFGMGTCHKDEKRYLFGALPIADAFIAWSNSFINDDEELEIYWAFHLFSGIIFLLVLLICWKW
ncbi:MAG: hypothetical protein MRY83_03765 [Flavobacteriales bacterium]|nr:hypothetical protein [Flavobacteriales bacterium]